MLLAESRSIQVSRCPAIWGRQVGCWSIAPARRPGKALARNRRLDVPAKSGDGSEGYRDHGQQQR